MAWQFKSVQKKKKKSATCEGGVEGQGREDCVGGSELEGLWADGRQLVEQGLVVFRELYGIKKTFFKHLIFFLKFLKKIVVYGFYTHFYIRVIVFK